MDGLLQRLGRQTRGRDKYRRGLITAFLRYPQQLRNKIIIILHISTMFAFRGVAATRTVLTSSKKIFFSPKRTVVTMSPLPYDVLGGVPPLISPKSLQLHYHNFCTGFCKTANDCIQGTPMDTLDRIIIIGKAKIDASSSLLYHSLGSVLNHELFFRSITPGGSPLPINTRRLIEANFGTVDELKRRFNKSAAATFSNGWTFLVVRDGRLEILNSRDGATAYGEKGVVPIACLDLWEHAYITDFEYRRNDYISRFWDVVDWQAIENRLNEKIPDIWLY